MTRSLSANTECAKPQLQTRACLRPLVPAHPARTVAGGRLDRRAPTLAAQPCQLPMEVPAVPGLLRSGSHRLQGRAFAPGRSLAGGRSWPAACMPCALWTPPATSDCPHPSITTAAAARAVSAAPCRRPARRCPTALPAGLRPRRAGSPRLRRSGSHAGRSRHLHRLGRRLALPPAAPGDRTEPFSDSLFRPMPQPQLSTIT